MCGYVSDKNSYIMIAVKHDPYRRVGKTELSFQYGLRGGVWRKTGKQTH